MLGGITKYLQRHHVALLALFLALGGTSFAAASFINGKQIKPGSLPKNRLTKSAIRSLKGNKGAQGQRGPTGAQGIQGIQGVQGIQGPAGPLITTLPAGATLRGMYSWAGRTLSAGYHPVVPLSFPFPLATAPTMNVIAVGGASTAACPGTAANPQAAAGNLCVYQSRNDGNLAIQALAEVNSGRYGADLYFPIATDKDYEYLGTWAVTAPAGSAPAHGPSHGTLRSN
jgi:hypothetical protein